VIGRAAAILLAAALALCAGAVGAGLLAPGTALAGTTGKIAGKVVDGQNRPLVGVNVALPALRTGAITDEDGNYTILNVPPGAWDLRLSLLGYGPVAVTGIQVSADLTARANATLHESAVELKEVVVRSTRPVVDVGKTSSLASVSSQEIAKLPVQELNDIVNLQAGVVDGHFRGGRIGEVQYQVDGVSVNNAYDNKTTLRLDRSLLEEVQVISGTFDAEYGQAQSGVVNAVLKRGTNRFLWNAEVYGGGFVFPTGEERRVNQYEFDPLAVGSFQVGASGPVPVASNTTFLLNARRGITDDWVHGQDVLKPTDFDRVTQGLVPTGTFEEVPLGDSREWSGVGKVSNRSLQNVEFSYQAIFNVIDAHRAEWAFALMPDGRPKQHTYSIVHGLDVNHVLNTRSFYNLSVRQNYFDYTDLVYEDFYDERYDSAGHLETTVDGYHYAGVSPTRFHQNTNTLVIKGSYVRQSSSTNQLKAGLDLQLPRVEFGTMGYLTFPVTEVGQQLVRVIEDPENRFFAPRLYFPVLAAGFAQEQIEWNSLTARAGVRVDMFDARSSIPGDLSNPTNDIAGAPTAPPQETTKKWAVSPRIGVSWPTGPRSAAHFAYGHFAQFPPIGEIFRNAEYSILSELQATPEATSAVGVMGNPDIGPERTIQYEGGYKQAVSEDLGVDLTVFYKDIRDLLGVEYISTYNGAEYARLTNVDFGDVLGFTLAFDLRPRGLFGMMLDYTWQDAQGNSSDPRETATRVTAGDDPRPRRIPLNWDQRHTLNVTATLSDPEDFTLSGIFRVGSGQPYTPNVTGGFGFGQEANSGRKPTGAVVDLRGEKVLRLGGAPVRAFTRIFNLFDTRYFNGPVFATTGSPYYSLNPGDEFALQNPTTFYAPRRIEVGLSFAGPWSGIGSGTSGGTP
jgi:outer membrane receptor protein involved in Fe transport